MLQVTAEIALATPADLTWGMTVVEHCDASTAAHH